MKYFEGSVTLWGQVEVEDDATEQDVEEALACEIDRNISVLLPVSAEDIENVQEIPEYRYW